jgi:integrase
VRGVFVRPRELRGARWSEFDFDGAEWRIPDERMKIGELHIVPLARQAAAILRDLQALTGALGGHVLPSLLTRTRPMSNNPVNTALRRLGYTKEQNDRSWVPDYGEHSAERARISA